MDTIRIEGLTKKYKDVVAVDNLNLSVKQGEIFSLLGVNGAGKTTIIKMLSCITRPTSGDAFLMGKSLSSEASTVKSLMAGVHGCGIGASLIGRSSKSNFPHIWWVLAYGLAIFVVAILLFLKQMKGR